MCIHFSNRLRYKGAARPARPPAPAGDGKRVQMHSNRFAPLDRGPRRESAKVVHGEVDEHATSERIPGRMKKVSNYAIGSNNRSMDSFISKHRFKGDRKSTLSAFARSSGRRMGERQHFSLSLTYSLWVLVYSIFFALQAER